VIILKQVQGKIIRKNGSRIRNSLIVLDRENAFDAMLTANKIAAYTDRASHHGSLLNPCMKGAKTQQKNQGYTNEVFHG
jgi:hypothetical protein